jgi:hypothetical protein
MADLELRNQSSNEFTDISSESYRKYIWESGAWIIIDKPQYLSVSKSGGHRLLDLEGKSHYIPPTWIHLLWKVKDGMPHFIK